MRVPVTLRIDFRKQGMQTSKAELHNISETGFMADTSMRLSQGDRVWATLPKLAPKEAVVVWTKEFYIGCEFVEPFADYVFANLIQRLEGS